LCVTAWPRTLRRPSVVEAHRPQALFRRRFVHRENRRCRPINCVTKGPPAQKTRISTRTQQSTTRLPPPCQTTPVPNVGVSELCCPSDGDGPGVLKCCPLAGPWGRPRAKKKTTRNSRIPAGLKQLPNLHSPMPRSNPPYKKKQQQNKNKKKEKNTKKKQTNPTPPLAYLWCPDTTIHFSRHELSPGETLNRFGPKLPPSWAGPLPLFFFIQTPVPPTPPPTRNPDDISSVSPPTLIRYRLLKGGRRRGRDPPS